MSMMEVYERESTRWIEMEMDNGYDRNGKLASYIIIEINHELRINLFRLTFNNNYTYIYETTVLINARLDFSFKL